MIDEKTKICISVAERPGTFGIKFHNEGYSLLGLNYAYIPLGVKEDELNSVMNIFKRRMHGCSVSMPHKVKVIDYLDELDEPARRIGAVNTILNLDGRLKGFNTDYYGARKAISSKIDIKEKRVVMLGAGGVARAVAYAIKDLGGILEIVNRTSEKSVNLAIELECRALDINQLERMEGDLFINATSIGMQSEESPISPKSISRYDTIMDCVIGDTVLITEAKKAGKTIIHGKSMTCYQAAEQFRIYTGRELPVDFINKFVL